MRHTVRPKLNGFGGGLRGAGGGSGVLELSTLIGIFTEGGAC